MALVRSLVSLRTRRLGMAAGVAAMAQALAFAGAALASSAPASALPAVTPGASTGAPSQPGAASAPQPRLAVLSNESTNTTWAHPVEEATIHLHPETSSRTIARARLVTEDGYPEVYLVLATFVDDQGRDWVHVRVPGRPNGLTGWVPEVDLGTFHLTHWHIVVSLGARRLKGYFQGRLRFAVPVGVGKPSTPTPTGHFWIRERFRLPNPAGPYGPWAFGTSAYSRLSDWPGGGVVGIHGDFGEPQSIPGDPSHGCVRMRDSDLARLAPRIDVGTPVTIVR
jgi:hypothetical protein